MIAWLKEKKRNYSLKRFRKKAGKVRFKHDFVDLKDAVRIGFILNTTNATAKDLVMITDYISKLEKKENKQIFLIELNFQRKSEPIFKETHQYAFINPKHINWLGFPSMEVLKALNSKPCDILIDLDQSEELTARFIIGLSNAKMRAGLHEEGFESFYDLMLASPKPQKLKTFLDELEVFLNMIKK